MTTPRWDVPWTQPLGLAPQRPPGEPSPSMLAVVHLAVWFGVSSVGAGVVAASGDSGYGVLVVAAVLLVAGLAVLTRCPVLEDRRSGLLAWVADLLLAVAVGYLFGGVALLARDQGAGDETATMIGAAAAVPVAVALYVVHRRLWLQVAAVATVTALLVSALVRQDEVPRHVLGAFLLVVGGFLALGCLSGLARPVASGYVLAAVLGTAGAQVLMDADALLGSTVTLVLLGAIGWGIVASRNRSLLPVALVAGAVLLPQVLSPAFGTGDAVALSMTSVAAAVAWLAVDLQRRSVRPVQVGGVFTVCLILVVVSSFSFRAGGDRDAGEMFYDALHAAVLVAFFAAAAAGRRRPATVVSGLFVVFAVPAALAAPLGGGAGATSAVGLVALGATVYAAIVLDRRGPRPAAVPWQQEVSLSGAGRDWTVQASYAPVFDAVVAVLGGAGLALQLVDRAAGRVVAGDAAMPVLVVAVWSADPLRTRVRAVGASQDVDRLEADVAARLNRLDAPH